MKVERIKDEIIIKLSGNIDMSDLQDIADWFQYKEIVRKSKASQKDVDELVKRIKKRRWDKTKAALVNK